MRFAVLVLVVFGLQAGCALFRGRGADPAPTAPADTTSAQHAEPSAPVMQVTLSEEERARLEEECLHDLRTGQEGLGAVAGKALSSEESEMVSVLRHLLEDARRAYRAEDLRTAARLASKARILAEELLER